MFDFNKKCCIFMRQTSAISMYRKIALAVPLHPAVALRQISPSCCSAKISQEIILETKNRAHKHVTMWRCESSRDFGLCESSRDFGEVGGTGAVGTMMQGRNVRINISKNKCRLAGAKFATYLLRDSHRAHAALHQCSAIVKSLLSLKYRV